MVNPLETKKKAVVAGHICLDITPVFPGNGKSRLSEVLIPGSLIKVGNASISTGGAVANTGLCMKLLGADVALMGKVGDDALGGIVLGLLDKHGLSRGMIVDPSGHTSYSVVIALPGTDRIFLHHSGVNDSFYAEDIKEDLLDEASLFHFGYPPIMRSLYENEGEELLKIFKKVKQYSCASSLDMCGVDPASEAAKADWEGILEKTLPYVDFFLPSAEELLFMLDRARYESLAGRSGGDILGVLNIDEDIAPLAERCLNMGARAALIKCGFRGIYYKTASPAFFAGLSPSLDLAVERWADREGFELSYKPDAVVSATGAGDACIAGFLSAMLSGYPPEKCLQFAAAVGASCVTAYDALSGIKPFPELEQKIDSGWEKLPPCIPAANH